MEQQIQNIKKNMQTKFQGYVNGLVFTDRNEMNAYIGKCISENIPIQNLQFSQTSSFTQANTGGGNGVRQIQQKQQEISWARFMNDLNKRVPQPYDTVIGYIVPFVHEDLFITPQRCNEVVTDFVARLNDRMTFMENYVLSQIRTWKYDESQVDAWLDDLITRLYHKTQWCQQRINIIENFLAGHQDKLIVNNINVAGLEAFHKIYSEAGGFCSAMIDICTDIKKQLNSGK